jgi:hypothetical protein
MMMLEKTMEKVCEWSERIEAQTSEAAQYDVALWAGAVLMSSNSEVNYGMRKQTPGRLNDVLAY